ncbi:hypothetical protein DERF_004365 [Dermatophagoides farinae]|uniref:Uncharacterized protein n=1 Tax=Dermatophagoides farinae TaxID=6954 RepID=A0A922I1T0_DERFA|nr:hypothetical protein DERF_004365 [Dermatophagoides farinae]
MLVVIKTVSSSSSLYHCYTLTQQQKHTIFILSWSYYNIEYLMKPAAATGRHDHYNPYTD